MVYKYWIEFDEEGDIKAFHKTKGECKGNCQEFIVKLIPVNRFEEIADTLDKEMNDLSKNVDGFRKTTKKVSTELNKIIHKIRI